jgi:pyruvate/2-oxoglutarate dehydrogenase complex dihydrolipoamide acyltransferase (E2) component
MSDAVAVKVPRANANDEDAVIVRWHVESGARIGAGEALVTIETSKAILDVEAPRGGYAFFSAGADTRLPVGATMAWITQDESGAELLNGDGADGAAARALDRFTRKAQKLMKEHGLAPADFAGEARVDAAQVEGLIAERAASPGAHTDSGPAADADLVELSPAKVSEARALSATHRDAVSSTVAITISSAAVDARLAALAAEVGPLSLLELAVFEVGAMLAQWPDLNGYFSGGHAYRYRSVGVGFALNAGRALRVPVVKSAAVGSLRAALNAVRELSLRYMRNELSVDDLAGGTFTVTDLSAYGVVHFVPVLNVRQAAILGLCAERPGSGARELVLTFDHRLADGMRAAEFLNALRTRLERSDR